MRISIPQKNKMHNESHIYNGELRDLQRFKEDHWQLKISIPDITIVDNFYATMTEEEIDFILQEICRYRNLTLASKEIRTEQK